MRLGEGLGDHGAQKVGIAGDGSVGRPVDGLDLVHHPGRRWEHGELAVIVEERPERGVDDRLTPFTLAGRLAIEGEDGGRSLTTVQPARG